MKTLTRSILCAMAAFGLIYAEDSGAKADIKDAGRSTKRAVKKTGSAAKKGTKKVVNKSAEGVEKKRR